MEKIGLREALAVLRRELAESIRDSADEALRFEINNVGIEFQVELERAVKGSAGVHFWVIKLGTGGEVSSTNAHTIKLSLTPRMADHSPVLTGGDEVPVARAPE